MPPVPAPKLNVAAEPATVVCRRPYLEYQIPGSMSAHAHRLIFKFEIALLEAVLELPHCEALGKCGEFMGSP